MNKRNKNVQKFSKITRSSLCALPFILSSGSVMAQIDEFQAIIDSDTTGPNASASASAILATCVTGANGGSEDNGNNRFQADCNALVGGSVDDPVGSTQGVNSLAADQVSAQNSVSVRRNDANLSVVAQRLSLLRVTSGYSAFGSDELIAANLLFEGKTGGGASADGSGGRMGVFLNGRYLDGNEDENELQDGFDFDGWGLITGLDYRFSDNFVGGLALSYSTGDADYDDNRGDLEAESWGVMGYGTFFVESGLYFEGSLGYNSLEYEMTRNISYQVGDLTAVQQMTSSPDGDSLSVSFGGGYTFGSDSWSFTPALRVDYLDNQIDSYQERSTNIETTGGAMALALGSTSFESLTSNLGLAIAKAISTNSGVVVPQISLDWVHEFEDDPTIIRARFVNDINRTRFGVGTTELDSDYFDLALGLSAQFQGGKSGFIAYRTLLDYDGLSYNSIEAGFRIEL